VQIVKHPRPAKKEEKNRKQFDNLNFTIFEVGGSVTSLYNCGNRLIMKRIGILVGGILAALSSLGQTAPNFTVHDTQGVTYNLYSDYLDQGRVVILGMFYVGAPWFQEVADSLENQIAALGQDGNIDMLYLSYVDSDAELIQFASDSGLLKPMIGNEGASGAAMAPYTIGSGFGIFYGYPLFVVVHEDRSVDYDPYGATPTEMVDAIMYAATGGVGVDAFDHERMMVYAANGNLVVQVSELTAVHLFDLSGREVLNSSTSTGTIDVDLPGGIYVYHLHNSTGSFSGKVYFP
jgi:hypothetical protein